MKKKVILGIILLCIIVNVSFVKAVKPDYGLLKKQINRYAKEEVESQFNSMTSLLWGDPDAGISGRKEEAKLGNPFIYYDANRTSNQNMDFYYPVMIKEKVVGIIEAILYNGDWTLSITDVKNDFKRLNEIDYVQEQPLFYVIGNKVFMETPSSSVEFTSLLDNVEETSLQKEFSLKSYEKKLQEIVQNTKKFNESIQSVKTAEISNEEKGFDTKSGKDSSQDSIDIKVLYVSITVAVLIVLVVSAMVIYSRKQ